MIRRALALALLAPALARAGDYQLSGSVDAGYGRTDAWAGGRTSASPTWDFGGQLSLGAAPIRPDLLQLAASGSYRKLQSSYLESRTTADNFGYAASAALLQGFPVSFNLFASRAWSDFNAVAETRQTGSSLSRTEGATAVLHFPRAPTIRATLQRTAFDNIGLGGQETTGESTRLSLGGSHNLENHSYSASYDTAWSEGTFAETNYRNHYFNFQGSALATRSLEVRLTENYYLRRPTVEAPTNPRYDDNNLNVTAFWRPSQTVGGTLGYAFRHTFFEAQGVVSQDSSANIVSLGGNYAWSQDWTFNATASLERGQDRLGAETRDTEGEAVGAGARWQRAFGDYTWNASADGSVGSTRALGQDLFAYGLGAGAGVNTSLAGWASGLSLSTSFSSNLLGQAGWSVRNAVSGQTETRLSLGIGLRGRLQVIDARQHSEFLGDSSNQTALLQVGASYRAHFAELSVGQTNGSAQNLVDPALNPNLPARFNTRSSFATLTGSSLLTPSLGVQALARYLSTTSPGGLHTWETAFNLRLLYRIGLFDLSAEDRYSVGGSGSVSRVNVFLVRATRSFGMGF